MLESLSFLSVGFVPFDCLLPSTGPFTAVYLAAAAPVAVAGLIGLNYCTRASAALLRAGTRDNTDVLSGLRSDHVGYVLLLTYLVLPAVSLRLFQSLLCEAVAGQSYMVLDTAVNCGSASFKLFAVFDALIIVAYLSVPFAWLVALRRARAALNPNTSDGALAVWLREHDSSLASLRFLFNVYLPRYYYWEPLEMYCCIL